MSEEIKVVDRWEPLTDVQRRTLREWLDAGARQVAGVDYDGDCQVRVFFTDRKEEDCIFLVWPRSNVEDLEPGTRVGRLQREINDLVRASAQLSSEMEQRYRMLEHETRQEATAYRIPDISFIRESLQGYEFDITTTVDWDGEGELRRVNGIHFTIHAKPPGSPEWVVTASGGDFAEVLSMAKRLVLRHRFSAPKVE